MLRAAAVVGAAYALGSVPVSYLVARRTRGIDIRRVGSGNVGASNVYQTVSRALVVPVGLTQVAQGAAGPLLARAAGFGAGEQAAAGVAAVVANDWNPWLRFAGGRGVGQAIGVMAATSPAALAAFIAGSLAGVAMRAIPQGVALGLLAAPLASAVAGDERQTSLGLAAIAATVMTKRLLGNGAPDPIAHGERVWWNRLLYDRDIRDREAWVRRGLEDAGR